MTTHAIVKVLTFQGGKYIVCQSCGRAVVDVAGQWKHIRRTIWKDGD